MATEARPQHNHQTRQQSVREWSDPKHDSRYVTRHELKSFFTIYDKAAAKVRAQETDRLEGTLLMTLDALTKWKALPWWQRIFTVPATPEVRRPEPVEGVSPDEQMPAPSHGTPEMEEGARAQPGINLAVKEDLDALAHGASSLGSPTIEPPTAPEVREVPWHCDDCHAEGLHQTSGALGDPPTCLHCGSGHTHFKVAS